MNYEIDNTKHVKVMIFEASDSKPETTKEITDLVMHYLDKGWMTLESLSFRPNFRMVLYWPEYKPNASGQIPPASGGNLDRLVGSSL